MNEGHRIAFYCYQVYIEKLDDLKLTMNEDHYRIVSNMQIEQESDLFSKTIWSLFSW